MRGLDWFYEEHAHSNLESITIDGSGALAQLDQLEMGINEGWTEMQVQDFLKRHRHLLLGRHRLGHGTFAFSEVALGNQFRIDWAIANGSSAGLMWELIELESPQDTPFKSSGHLGKTARAGLEQILDWRRWIKDNIDYVQRRKSQSGLGLHGVDINRGIVIVGRRAEYEERAGGARYNDVRRELSRDSHIEIASYETFIESLRFQFNQRQIRQEPS